MASGIGSRIGTGVYGPSLTMRPSTDMDVGSAAVSRNASARLPVGNIGGGMYGPRTTVGNTTIGAGFGSGAVGGRGAIGGIGATTRFKSGGKTKKMAKGGSTASKRADGCAQRGKTKGKMV